MKRKQRITGALLVPFMMFSMFSVPTAFAEEASDNSLNGKAKTASVSSNAEESGSYSNSNALGTGDPGKIIAELNEDFSGYQDGELSANDAYKLIGGDNAKHMVSAIDFDGDIVTLKSDETGRVGIKLKDDAVFTESEVWVDVRFNSAEQMQHIWDGFAVNTYYLDESNGCSVVLSDKTNQAITKVWNADTTTVLPPDDSFVPGKWYSLHIKTSNAASQFGSKVDFSLWDSSEPEPTDFMAGRQFWFLHFNYDLGVTGDVKMPTLVWDWASAVGDPRDLHFVDKNGDLAKGSLALYVDQYSEESNTDISFRNLKFKTNSAEPKYQNFELKPGEDIWEVFEPMSCEYNLENGPNIWNKFNDKSDTSPENYYGIYEPNAGYQSKAGDANFISQKTPVTESEQKKILDLESTDGKESGIIFNTNSYENSILDMRVRFNSQNAEDNLTIAPVNVDDENPGSTAALATITPSELSAVLMKSGVEIGESKSQKFTVAPDKWYNVRLQTMDKDSSGYNDGLNYLRVKIWEQGTKEPSGFQIERGYSEDSVGAGKLAVYASNTAGKSVDVSVMDVRLKGYEKGGLPETNTKLAQVQGIQIDGTEIFDFDQNQTEYNYIVTGNSVPRISAKADNWMTTVNIQRPSSIPGDATITVKGLTSGSTVYTVHFIRAGRTIASIEESQADVRKGVDLRQNMLPSLVNVTLSDGEKIKATVEWNYDEFDHNNPDPQTITGKIYPDPIRGITVADTDLARLTVSQRPIQKQIFISPIGNDMSGDGSFEKPYQTLSKAKDVVGTLNSSMTGDIIVYLRGGTYHIEEPLAFGVNDSGSNGYNVIYQAYPGETPEISGGKRLDSQWEQVDPSEANGVSGIYKTTLDRDKKLRAIYVNGQKAKMTEKTVRAQYQVGKMNVTGEEFWAETPGWAWTSILFKKSDVGLYENPEDVEIWEQGAAWNSNTIGIQDIYEYSYSAEDERLWGITEADAGNYIAFDPQQPYGAIFSRLTCYCNLKPLNDQGKRQNMTIRNTFENLKNPGEFYFDKSTQTLYYYPRNGESMENAEVIVPESKGIMKILGDSTSSHVENLIFDGIKFSYDDYLLQEIYDPEIGYTAHGWGGIQSLGLASTFRQEGSWHPAWYNNAEPPDASVEVRNANDILFVNNNFTNLANSCNISYTNDVTDSGIIGNTFKDTAGNAINVGHPQHVFIGEDPFSDNQVYDPNNEEGICKSIQVTYNYVTEVAQDFDQGDAIMAFYAENCDFSHNEVFNVPYTCICVGWGWWQFNGDYDSFVPGNPSLTAKDNRVMFNHFYDSNKKHGGDGGTLYTLGYQPNSVIAYNYVHDFSRLIYLDEGSAGIYSHDNVMENGGWMINGSGRARDLIRDHNFYPEGADVGWSGAGTNPVYQSSWNGEAQSVIDNAGLGAYSDIIEDIDNTVNKDILLYEIQYAEIFEESQSSSETWQALTLALKAARTVYEDDSATQKQVDDAADNLKKVLDGLKNVSGQPLVAENVVGFMTLDANGTSIKEDTTELYLRFTDDVDLELNDIAVENATATEFVGSGQNYTLKISNITVANGDEVKVTVSKDPYHFIPMSRQVPVSKFTQYTLSYDLNGGGSGDVPEPTKVFLNDTFMAATADSLVSTDPNKAFKEWNTQADGKGTSYAPGETITMPNHDLTLYAIWDDLYTVTFEVTGENGTIEAAVNGKTISSGDKVLKGSEIVFTAKAEGNYMVKTWTKDGQPVGDKSKTYTLKSLTKETAVTVEFEPKPDYLQIPEDGLDLWLSADEGVETEESGSQPVVLGWKNIAGNGTDVALTSGQTKPILKTDSTNGYRYLEFSTGTTMEGTLKNYNKASEMTVIAINIPTGGMGSTPIENNQVRRCTVLRIGDIGLTSALQGSEVTFNGYNGNTYAHYKSDNSKSELVTLIGVRQNGTDKLYVDGLLKGELSGRTEITNTSDKVILGGAAIDYYSSKFQGGIAEVLVYDRALTESEISKIQTYVDAKYFGKISQNSYAVNFDTVGENGSVNAEVDSQEIQSGDVVSEGKSVRFTAVPQEGYRVKEWKVDGTVVNGNTSNTYTLDNLSKETTVTVEFTNKTVPGIPTDGLDLWVKADEGVVTDGESVLGWENQAGGDMAGKLLTPVDGKKKPTWGQDDQYSYIQFSPTGNGKADGDELELKDFKDYNGKSGVTVIAMNLPEDDYDIANSWADWCQVLHIAEDGDFGGLALSASVSGAAARLGYGGTTQNPEFLKTVTSVSDLMAMTIVKDGTTEKMYFDGNLTATLEGRPETISRVGSRLCIGGAFSDGAYAGGQYKGKVAEVLVYDRALTDDEIIAVNEYLANKYLLESITIEGPTKTEYEVGDEIDLNGLVVTAHYSDGTDKTISNYEVSGFDSSTAGEKSVTVSYGGKTAQFRVNVQEAEPPVTLQSISLTGPAKTEYAIGEELDLDGLVITAHYSDGTSKPVAVADCEITGFDSSAAGVKTITVTYEEKTVTFKVTVKESIPVVTVDSISLSGPTKTEYEIGEDLDLTGLVVTAHYSDGSHKPVTDYEVSDFDSSTAGEKIITVTYKDKTATFKVNVKEAPQEPILESITVKGPTKTQYAVGEVLNLEGLEITAHYSDGTSKPVAVTDCEVTGFDSSVVEVQTVTVTYRGTSATFEVEVIAPPVLESITVEGPDKTEYGIGENLDLKGLVITAHYSDGHEVVITEGFEVTGFDSATTGKKKVTVSYLDKTAFFEVNISEASMTSITVEGLFKTEYEIGEKLNLEGLVVTVHYSDGTSRVITDYDVAGFDSMTAGTKTLTVSYQGMTETFEIIIKESGSSQNPDNPSSQPNGESETQSEISGGQTAQTGDGFSTGLTCMLVFLILGSLGSAMVLVKRKNKNI